MVSIILSSIGIVCPVTIEHDLDHCKCREVVITEQGPCVATITSLISAPGERYTTHKFVSRTSAWRFLSAQQECALTSLSAPLLSVAFVITYNCIHKVSQWSHVAHALTTRQSCRMSCRIQPLFSDNLLNTASLSSHGRHRSILSERSNVGFLVARFLKWSCFSDPY